MEHFTPGLSTVGGILIGLSAALLLLLMGRIAGISGIASGLLSPTAPDFRWRLPFTLGLVAAGAAASFLWPAGVAYTPDRSLWLVGIAGLLVGLGTRLGSGCTSGHGVCGLGRLSFRSFIAVVVFLATGMITVGVMNQLGGS